MRSTQIHAFIGFSYGYPHFDTFSAKLYPKMTKKSLKKNRKSQRLEVESKLNVEYDAQIDFA